MRLASVAMIALACGSAAWAQGGGAVPRIVSIEWSTTPCASPTTWEFGVDDCLRERTTIFVCLTIEDLDYVDDDGMPADEVVYLTMTSTWIPFTWQGIVYGPEPPAVSTDRDGSIEGYLYGPYGSTGSTTRDIQLQYAIPQFVGSNQARLRGLIDYDVRWAVTIQVFNEEELTPEVPRDVAILDLCAIENPLLNPGNPPPFADAGGDQIVAIGDVVRLDGSRSFDRTNLGFDPNDPEVFSKDELTYAWEWMEGPVRVDPVADPNEPPVSPYALVTFDVVGTYVYRLTVDDGVNTPPSTDLVQIEVRTSIPANRPPIARITGPDAPVTVGETIELSAATSSDPDGDTLTFTWIQTNEVGGALLPDELQALFQPMSGIDTNKVTWQANNPGTFYLAVVVRDPGGLSDRALFPVDIVAGGQNAQTALGSAPGEADADDAGSPAVGADGPAPTGACGAGGLMPLTILPMLLWQMHRRPR